MQKPESRTPLSYNRRFTISLIQLFSTALRRVAGINEVIISHPHRPVGRCSQNVMQTHPPPLSPPAAPQARLRRCARRS
eukprot:5635490-Prymnesium_polylepis.1